MIKLKATYRELEALHNYLDNCITGQAKTQDQVKEYFLAHALSDIQRRIFKKMAALYHEQMEAPRAKKYIIKVHNDEMLALMIYFNRVKIYDFLVPVQTDILFRIPEQLLKIQQCPTSAEFSKSFSEGWEYFSEHWE